MINVEYNGETDKPLVFLSSLDQPSLTSKRAQNKTVLDQKDTKPSVMG